MWLKGWATEDFFSTIQATRSTRFSSSCLSLSRTHIITRLKFSNPTTSIYSSYLLNDLPRVVWGIIYVRTHILTFILTVNDIRLNNNAVSSDPLATGPKSPLHYSLENPSNFMQCSWIIWCPAMAFEWHFRSVEITVTIIKLLLPSCENGYPLMSRIWRRKCFNEND